MVQLGWSFRKPSPWMFTILQILRDMETCMSNGSLHHSELAVGMFTSSAKINIRDGSCRRLYEDHSCADNQII